MIIIGSRAIKFWEPLRFTREPKDWDIVSSITEFEEFTSVFKNEIVSCYPGKTGKYRIRMKNGDQFEIEFSDSTNSNGILEKICQDSSAMLYQGIWKFKVPPLIVLYLIKRSHIYWPVHWQKNIRDLHFLRRVSQNQFIEDIHRSFYIKRLAESSKKFGGLRQASLDMENSDFFKKSAGSVKRYFEHDSLHEIVKQGKVPAYQMAKKDPTRAIMNKDLFQSLDDSHQLDAVSEEAMVIALERILVPKWLAGDDISKEEMNRAYSWALMRICTTLTSGWFRDFAINNWEYVNEPPVDFVQLLSEAVLSDKLKLTVSK